MRPYRKQAPRRQQRVPVLVERSRARERGACLQTNAWRCAIGRLSREDPEVGEAFARALVRQPRALLDALEAADAPALLQQYLAAGGRFGRARVDWPCWSRVRLVIPWVP